jgi:hypothetical protein
MGFVRCILRFVSLFDRFLHYSQCVHLMSASKVHFCPDPVSDITFCPYQNYDVGIDVLFLQSSYPVHDEELYHRLK